MVIYIAWAVNRVSKVKPYTITYCSTYIESTLNFIQVQNELKSSFSLVVESDYVFCDLGRSSSDSNSHANKNNNFMKSPGGFFELRYLTNMNVWRGVNLAVRERNVGYKCYNSFKYNVIFLEQESIEEYTGRVKKK